MSEMDVARQSARADSTLSLARRFLAWRRSQPALVGGGIRFLDSPEPVLAFVRDGGGQRLLVAFNLSDAPVRWQADALAGAGAMTGHGLPSGQADAAGLSLPPYGVYFATLP